MRGDLPLHHHRGFHQDELHVRQCGRPLHPTGGSILLDNTLVEAPCFVQLFNADMREVDYNFATLKEAKAAVESIAFMYVNWKSRNAPRATPTPLAPTFPNPVGIEAPPLRATLVTLKP